VGSCMGCQCREAVPEEVGNYPHVCHGLSNAAKGGVGSAGPLPPIVRYRAVHVSQGGGMKETAHRYGGQLTMRSQQVLQLGRKGSEAGEELLRLYKRKAGKRSQAEEEKEGQKRQPHPVIRY